MPTKNDSGTGRAPRTLAEKLQWLRELNTPRGESPPSYDVTARKITETTGISISGPYYWELVTGRTTNPKLHHLRAIARFFNVPVGYLSEDDTDFERFESALELLQALRQRGAEAVTGEDAGGGQVDLTTIQTLFGRLEVLGLPGGQEVHERLSALSSRQRATVHRIICNAALLEALDDKHLQELVSTAAHLSDGCRTSLLGAARRPDLLEVFHIDDIQDTALRLAAMSDTSRQAARAVIDRLHQLEESALK
jgi:transcriptional regulator with XRE-family HTH domain